MTGEVDGGGARVSTFAALYEHSKKLAGTRGWDVALAQKPVQVLEGLDHSDFCPGLFVTAIKDCKSEVTQDVALATNWQVSVAFLHLNSPLPEATTTTAMAVMKYRLMFTQVMVEPFLAAFQLEKGALASPPAGMPKGSWCQMASETIVGLSAADHSKFNVEPCKLITTGLHDFEHQHTKYSVRDGKLGVDCFTAGELRGSSQVESLYATSADLKMVDATRVAEQLHVTTNSSIQSADINRKAVEVALKLLPAKSLARHQKNGRGICYIDDYTVTLNIGTVGVV